MNKQQAISRPSLRGTDPQIREAVLLIFCETPPAESLRLWQMPEKEWERLLPWLDTSGLALYFLDRVTQLELCDLVPAQVIARLQQNLRDNTLRTNSLVNECAAIQQRFQKFGLTYALLKGFSLWPCSVPRLELRSQLDLDFLIAEECAPAAQQILEERGYRLHAVSGGSWEFKANEMRSMSLRDLYKDLPSPSVELHVESQASPVPALLHRRVNRTLWGVCTPVLSSVDLFLRQGMHLHKHIYSEFSRAAHLIEFRRHVIARYDDTAFWQELQRRADGDAKVPLALGLVTLLITELMGPFAPQDFTRWTVDRLPAAARLWVSVYGRRTVLAAFPGNKLYLLLQRQLAATSVAGRRSMRQALIPQRLPPLVAHSTPDESLTDRMRRYGIQLRFLWMRMRFHIVEGLRYLYEAFRWRQLMKGLAS